MTSPDPTAPRPAPAAAREAVRAILSTVQHAAPETVGHRRPRISEGEYRAARAALPVLREAVEALDEFAADWLCGGCGSRSGFKESVRGSPIDGQDIDVECQRCKSDMTGPADDIIGEIIGDRDGLEEEVAALRAQVDTLPCGHPVSDWNTPQGWCVACPKSRVDELRARCERLERERDAAARLGAPEWSAACDAALEERDRERARAEAAERERERMERVCREVAHECYVRGRTYHFDGEKETPAEVFRQIEDYVTAAIRALPGEGE